ncbi:MAG: rhodanese-like domain-containing protein [Acidobacteriota bacterium]
MRIIRDAALFVAATLVLGTAFNLAPGRHVEWWGHGIEPPAAGVDFQLIDPASADAMRLSLPTVVFIDTRPEPEVRAARVPGAVSLPLPEVDRLLTPELTHRLRNADAVVIYGAAEETDVEQLLAQQLRLRGMAPPWVLAGGFPAWEASGLEADRERSS